MEVWVVLPQRCFWGFRQPSSILVYGRDLALLLALEGRWQSSPAGTFFEGHQRSD